MSRGVVVLSLGARLVGRGCFVLAILVLIAVWAARPGYAQSDEFLFEFSGPRVMGAWVQTHATSRSTPMGTSGLWTAAPTASSIHVHRRLRDGRGSAHADRAAGHRRGRPGLRLRRRQRAPQGGEAECGRRGGAAVPERARRTALDRCRRGSRSQRWPCLRDQNRDRGGECAAFPRRRRILGALAPGEPLVPHEIAVSPAGEVHVITDGQVSRYSRDGTFRGPTSQKVLRAAWRSTASGTCTSESRPAAPGSPEAVWRYRDHDVIGRIGEGSAGITAVAVDCRGNVYVGDRGAVGDPPVAVGRIGKYGDPLADPPPCGAPRPLEGTIDVRVDDIEITQAIQPFRRFERRPGQAARAYNAPASALLPAQPEVPLRRGGKTVVRVYASLHSGPAGGLAGVPATLEARSRAGRDLGSITAQAALLVLRVGDGIVDFAQRSDPAGAYTFTLPDEWTHHGTLDITARAIPPGSDATPPAASAQCSASTGSRSCGPCTRACASSAATCSA